MGITIPDVGAAVQTAQGFLQILGDLTAARSAIFQVDNKTKMTLVFISHADQHGGVLETPPTQIPPGSAGVFSAQSTGLGTGVQGSATYAGAGFDFTLNWIVPFLGSNQATADINGEMGSRYTRSAIAGVGVQKVHMHFELTANVLDFAAIPEKNQALQAGGLSLGNPVGAENANSDNVGRHQDYEFGTIYWSPSTTAHEVHGAILNKWTSLGRENYGYPTSDEMDVLGGKVNHFQKLFPGQVLRASIYWSPQTGAHEVRGLIREAWWGQGGPSGWLGFPKSDEGDLPAGAGRISLFEHGSISWSPISGIIIIPS